MFSLKHKRVWVAGHNGMVGQALIRRLSHEPCTLLHAARSDLDCRDQAQVHRWMHAHKPDAVIIAAAHVGGILANAENPATFFYNNMMIAANIIHAAHEAEVEKLVFLGSSCIYPRDCRQPIKEEQLLSGALESTNEAYALAKIAGLKMARYYHEQYGRRFISAMPCNLFGIGDTYDARRSHVIPALIMKAYAAKDRNAESLTLWGTGAPLREFLDVDDLADGLIFLLQHYEGAEHINIGAGQDISIHSLAKIICAQIDYTGDIHFDPAYPNGTPRKCLDISRLRALGWQPKTLKEHYHNDYEAYLSGMIRQACADYLERYGTTNSSQGKIKIAL